MTDPSIAHARTYECQCTATDTSGQPLRDPRAPSRITVTAATASHAEAVAQHTLAAQGWRCVITHITRLEHAE